MRITIEHEVYGPSPEGWRTELVQTTYVITDRGSHPDGRARYAIAVEQKDKGLVLDSVWYANDQDWLLRILHTAMNQAVERLTEGQG